MIPSLYDCSHQDMSSDVVAAVSSRCEQLCAQVSPQNLQGQAEGSESELSPHLTTVFELVLSRPGLACLVLNDRMLAKLYIHL